LEGMGLEGMGLGRNGGGLRCKVGRGRVQGSHSHLDARNDDESDAHEAGRGVTRDV